MSRIFQMGHEPARSSISIAAQTSDHSGQQQFMDGCNLKLDWRQRIIDFTGAALYVQTVCNPMWQTSYKAGYKASHLPCTRPFTLAPVLTTTFQLHLSWFVCGFFIQYHHVSYDNFYA